MSPIELSDKARTVKFNRLLLLFNLSIIDLLIPIMLVFDVIRKLDMMRKIKKRSHSTPPTNFEYWIQQHWITTTTTTIKIFLIKYFILLVIIIDDKNEDNKSGRLF